VKDYLSSTCKSILDGKVEKINLPKSDVLQFITENGSKISVRPSGTEPKIKFYFGVKGVLPTPEDFYKVDKELEDQVEVILQSLSI
jgi:phosphoglucomutase